MTVSRQANSDVSHTVAGCWGIFASPLRHYPDNLHCNINVSVSVRIVALVCIHVFIYLIYTPFHIAIFLLGIGVAICPLDGHNGVTPSRD